MQLNNTYKQNCKCRTKSEHKIIQLQSNENKPSLYHFLPFFFSSMKLIHLQAHFVYVRVNKYLQMINIKMTVPYLISLSDFIHLHDPWMCPDSHQGLIICKEPGSSIGPWGSICSKAC